MPEDWNEFLAEGVADERQLKLPSIVEMLEAIRARLGPAREGVRALEVGFGRGAAARKLASEGYDVVGIDVSEELVASAKAGANGSTARFEVGDAFDLDGALAKAWPELGPDGKVDVTYHQGLAEHFKWREAVGMLEAQGRRSRYVVFSVPNSDYLNHFPAGLRGDEWLRPVGEWRQIAEQAGLSLEECRSYGEKEANVLVVGFGG